MTCRSFQIPSKVYLLTGLPCSGKSTIAIALNKQLQNLGQPSIILDADDIRRDLWPELKYSPEDREENLRRFTSLAKRLSDQGLTVIMALLAPYEVIRAKMRDTIGHKFVEVFVATPLSVCEERDVKGMYKKARTGEIKEFTGISAPFEVPQAPDITCFTQDTIPEEEAATILDYVLKHEKMTEAMEE